MREQKFKQENQYQCINKPERRETEKRNFIYNLSRKNKMGQALFDLEHAMSLKKVLL